MDNNSITYFTPYIIGIIFSANFYIEVDFFLCGVGGETHPPHDTSSLRSFIYSSVSLNQIFGVSL